MGDLATWVDAAGTWAVGFIAGVIAWQQLRAGGFRPDFDCYLSKKEPQWLVIVLTNMGNSPGEVEQINAVAKHGHPIEENWRDWGLGVPFTLAGRSSATVVVEGKHFTVEQSQVTIECAGKQLGPKSPRAVEHRIAATTVLPPGTPRPSAAELAPAQKPPAETVSAPATDRRGGPLERLCRCLGI